MDHSELGLAEVLPHLARLSTMLNRSHLAERAMEETGIALDRPGLNVLLTLHKESGPLRVGEIADRMNVVGPHVTRQLHDLERRGLVHRVTDPLDQRARLIELTPDGADVAGRYLRTVLGWINGALADWSQEDRRAFVSLLGRFMVDLTGRLAEFDDSPSA